MLLSSSGMKRLGDLLGYVSTRHVSALNNNFHGFFFSKFGLTIILVVVDSNCLR
jgi:hypothetical protein